MEIKNYMDCSGYGLECLPAKNSKQTFCIWRWSALFRNRTNSIKNSNKEWKYPDKTEVHIGSRKYSDKIETVIGKMI